MQLPYTPPVATTNSTVCASLPLLLPFPPSVKLESPKSNPVRGASAASASSRDGKMPCPDPRFKYKPLNCAEEDRKFPCVEVWSPDGTSKRFALGTRASFVADRFNTKLVDAVKQVVCVEAFKHGEEPVEFGPDAPLMAMCEWDLRVVQEAPFEPIRVGDKIPDGELSSLDDDGKLQCYGIHDLVREKRVVFCGVPGAFTPTCRFDNPLVPFLIRDVSAEYFREDQDAKTLSVF